MRKIREILRLRFDCHCSHLAIAKSIGIGESTVGDCLGRIKKANLEWPLPNDLTDDALEALLYPSALKFRKAEEKGNEKEGGSELAIDWNYIHKELKRKHVTLLLLWEEYKRARTSSLSYTIFHK
jgi:transposase